MSDLIELKKLIEDIGTAHKNYRETNDERIAKLAKGESVTDIETKLAKIDADLDRLGDIKAQFDEIEKKLNRPFNPEEAKAAADLDVEVKTFNLARRADATAKGKSVGADLSVDEYKGYKDAFFKMAIGGEKMITGDEQKALSAGSDPDGGYLLPPSTVGRMVTRLFEQSTMRQLATVQVISSNKLEGIVDNDEADAGWVSELGTRNDTDTPQVGKYEIEAHEMYAQPKASQRILDDAAVDVEGWLAGKVADKFGRVEGAGFTTGTGVGQPRGLFAYTTAATSDDTRAWGQFEHVVTGANGAFHTNKADPLQDLIGAFKPQYLQNASFLMTRGVRTAIRKMKEATSDRYLWEPSLQAGAPDRLLGYEARVDQFVPAVATGSLSLALGDFRETYTIVDRLGIRTLRDPYTSKPYVKFYSTKRTGGGAVNFDSMKFLKFST